jgi:hypothetical protein
MYWEKEIETMSREQLKTLQFIITENGYPDYFKSEIG